MGCVGDTIIFVPPGMTEEQHFAFLTEFVDADIARVHVDVAAGRVPSVVISCSFPEVIQDELDADGPG